MTQKSTVARNTTPAVPMTAELEDLRASAALWVRASAAHIRSVRIPSVAHGTEGAGRRRRCYQPAAEPGANSVPKTFNIQFGSQRRERELLLTFGDDREPRRATQSSVGRLRPRGQTSRMSYCSRAVSHCIATNIEKVSLPALTAPRAGLEPAAYCLVLQQ
jgi:hypothetical protein